MLKHKRKLNHDYDYKPAAFRRLCVETFVKGNLIMTMTQPPSGGCVLKPTPDGDKINRHIPAAFRRLCVETAATTMAR